MEFRHPKSGQVIEGERLLPGDIILDTDMYDDDEGAWEPAGYYAGSTVNFDEDTIWVRPFQSAPE